MNNDASMKEGDSVKESVKEQDSAMKQVEVNIPYPENWIYSNVASFSISPMDIRIGFAEVMPNGHATPRIGIVMTPDQAATLALTLLGQLETYERHFGELRSPQWKKLIQGLRTQPDTNNASTTPEVVLDEGL